MRNWRFLQIYIFSIMICVNFMSCADDDDDISVNNGYAKAMVERLMSYKWVSQSTDYYVYSYGSATYTQIWTVYFISENRGIIRWRTVDRDSSLGTSRREEHVDFSYSIAGKKILLSDGSNSVFEYFGDYLMEGETIYTPQELDSSDESYLQTDPEEGKIDTKIYVINDSNILKATADLGDGLYLYTLDFAFGAVSDDAYKKGVTKMRATVWAENGCIDCDYNSSEIGKKKTYTLSLSSTDRDYYNWIFIQAKSKSVRFHFEIDYYNSKNGKWYDVINRCVTLYVDK